MKKSLMILPLLILLFVNSGYAVDMTLAEFSENVSSYWYADEGDIFAISLDVILRSATEDQTLFESLLEAAQAAKADNTDAIEAKKEKMEDEDDALRRAIIEMAYYMVYIEDEDEEDTTNIHLISVDLDDSDSVAISSLNYLLDAEGINFAFEIDTPPSPIPEPATMLLFASGLVGLAGLRRRFKKS